MRTRTYISDVVQFPSFYTREAVYRSARMVLRNCERMPERDILAAKYCLSRFLA